MEDQVMNITLAKNRRITIKAIPGHFTNGHIHTGHYLDVSSLKSNALLARDVARELALPYLSSTLVDTIVCMERTEVIGAYLAEELQQEGAPIINSGGEIHVVAPLQNMNGNLIFPDSTVEWITDRNILLLVATVFSGRTTNSALECLTYYGGKIAGISALFLASPQSLDQEIHTLFTAEDIPGYKLSSPEKCDLCAIGQKLDAIISSEGYTKTQWTTRS